MTISLYRSLPVNIEEHANIHTVGLMNTISHAIENIVVQHGLQVDFYAGFQRFSFFLRQAERYKKLAQAARRVYVWGVADVTPPQIDGVVYVPIEPDHELAREWFVVVDSPEFFTALMTHEATFGQAIPKAARRFRGVWTYDADIIARAHLLLSQDLGLRYRPVIQRDYTTQNRFLVQISNELAQLNDQRNQVILHEQLLRSAFVRNEAPMMLLDASETVISASLSACRLLDLPVEQVQGRKFDTVGQSRFAGIQLNWAEFPSGEELMRINDETMISIRNHALLGTHGQPVGWVVQFEELKEMPLNDVTFDQPYNLSQLREKQMLVRQLVEVLPRLGDRPEIYKRALARLRQLNEEVDHEIEQLDPQKAPRRSNPKLDTFENNGDFSPFQKEFNRY